MKDVSAFAAFVSSAVGRGAPWLADRGADADVVMSSRVRLARNIEGFPFLSRAQPEQRRRIVDITRARLGRVEREAVGGGSDLAAVAPPTESLPKEILWIEVGALSVVDRTFLMERHLISKDLIKGDLPRAAAVSVPDERLSIMINEEDHLRLQVVRPGLDLTGALAAADQADDCLEGGWDGPDSGGIEQPLVYAYHPRFGFLTACPTNVGTGIRASVMLHLPALTMTGEIEKVKRATKDMGLTVRGYYGEGSDAAGDLYQVSNQTTLGKPERVILHELERQIIPQIVGYERQARTVLMDKRRRILEDRVWRALGTLRNARLLTPEETITLLSHLRLGVVAGLITDVQERTVNNLILLAQPAHLQKLLGKELDQNERREARADLVRASLRPSSQAH